MQANEQPAAVAAGAGSAGPYGNAAIERIALAMSRWRLLFSRRYIGRTALEKAAPGLKPVSLDIIEAVRRLSENGEATVGAVAEIMNIDQSRSSRMIADLVESGMLKRAISQADGRRAVVELGDRAEQFFVEKRRVQRALIGEITREWPAEDVDKFSELYDRFVNGLEIATRTERS